MKNQNLKKLKNKKLFNFRHYDNEIIIILKINKNKIKFYTEFFNFKDNSIKRYIIEMPRNTFLKIYDLNNFIFKNFNVKNNKFITFIKNNKNNITSY